MRRQPTPHVKTLLERMEARRMVGYLDVAGIPTAGVGHTGPGVRSGVTYSPAQVDAWFDEDIADAVAAIYRYVPDEVIARIPDESYDALVSFIFNVGDQAFRSPKTGKETNFSKALCAGRFSEVDDRMRDWVFAGGRKVTGLINRRAAEASQWNYGFKFDEQPQHDRIVADVVPVVLPTIPEETGVVPDAPVKEPIPLKSMFATATTVVGGAIATVAPEAVTTAGSQMRSLLPDIPFFSLVGGVLIAAGIGLTLWHQFRRSQKTGA